MRRSNWPRHVPQVNATIIRNRNRGGCDNLDKRVNRYSVPDIWADAPKLMMQESDEQASMEILDLEVNA